MEPQDEASRRNKFVVCINQWKDERNLYHNESERRQKLADTLFSAFDENWEYLFLETENITNLPNAFELLENLKGMRIKGTEFSICLPEKLPPKCKEISLSIGHNHSYSKKIGSFDFNKWDGIEKLELKIKEGYLKDVWSPKNLPQSCKEVSLDISAEIRLGEEWNVGISFGDDLREWRGVEKMNIGSFVENAIILPKNPPLTCKEIVIKGKPRDIIFPKNLEGWNSVERISLDAQFDNSYTFGEVRLSNLPHNIPVYPKYLHILTGDTNIPEYLVGRVFSDGFTRQGSNTTHRDYLNSKGQHISSDEHINILEKTYINEPNNLLKFIITMSERGTSAKRAEKLLQKSKILHKWLGIENNSSKNIGTQLPSVNREDLDWFARKVNNKKLKNTAQERLKEWDDSFNKKIDAFGLSENDRLALIKAKKENFLPLPKNVPLDFLKYYPHLTKLEIHDPDLDLGNPETQQSLLAATEQLKDLQSLKVNGMELAHGRVDNVDRLALQFTKNLKVPELPPLLVRMAGTQARNEWELCLSKNNLSEWETFNFFKDAQGAKGLKHIFLEDCSLTKYPIESKDLPAGVVLHLAGNPLPLAEIERLKTEFGEERVLFTPKPEQEFTPLGHLTTIGEGWVKNHGKWDGKKREKAWKHICDEIDDAKSNPDHKIKLDLSKYRNIGPLPEDMLPIIGMHYGDRITSFNISGGGVSGEVDISSFTALEEVNANRNEHANIKGLETLEHLEEVNLSHAGLSEKIDFSEWQAAKQLTDVNISENGITEVSGLGELESLQSLNVSKNGLTKNFDLSALAAAKNLRMVDLSDNQIANVKGMETVPGLKELNLERNLFMRVPPDAYNVEYNVKMRGNKLHPLAPKEVMLIQQGLQGREESNIDMDEPTPSILGRESLRLPTASVQANVISHEASIRRVEEEIGRVKSDRFQKLHEVLRNREELQDAPELQAFERGLQENNFQTIDGALEKIGEQLSHDDEVQTFLGELKELKKFDERWQQSKEMLTAQYKVSMLNNHIKINERISEYRDGAESALEKAYSSAAALQSVDMRGVKVKTGTAEDMKWVSAISSAASAVSGHLPGGAIIKVLAAGVNWKVGQYSDKKFKNFNDSVAESVPSEEAQEFCKASARGMSLMMAEELLQEQKEPGSVLEHLEEMMEKEKEFFSDAKGSKWEQLGAYDAGRYLKPIASKEAFAKDFHEKPPQEEKEEGFMGKIKNVGKTVVSGVISIADTTKKAGSAIGASLDKVEGGLEIIEETTHEIGQHLYSKAFGEGEIIGESSAQEAVIQESAQEEELSTEQKLKKGLQYFCNETYGSSERVRYIEPLVIYERPDTMKLNAVVENSTLFALENLKKIGDLETKWKSREKTVREQGRVIEEQSQKINIQDERIAEQDRVIEEQDRKIDIQNQNIRSQDDKIAQQDAVIIELEGKLSEQDERIKEQLEAQEAQRMAEEFYATEKVTEQDEFIRGKAVQQEAALANRDTQIDDLRRQLQEQKTNARGERKARRKLTRNLKRNVEGFQDYSLSPWDSESDVSNHPSPKEEQQAFDFENMTATTSSSQQISLPNVPLASSSFSQQLAPLQSAKSLGKLKEDDSAQVSDKNEELKTFWENLKKKNTQSQIAPQSTSHPSHLLSTEFQPGQTGYVHDAAQFFEENVSQEHLNTSSSSSTTSTPTHTAEVIAPQATSSRLSSMWSTGISYASAPVSILRETFTPLSNEERQRVKEEKLRSDVEKTIQKHSSVGLQDAELLRKLVRGFQEGTDFTDASLRTIRQKAIKSSNVKTLLQGLAKENGSAQNGPAMKVFLDLQKEARLWASNRAGENLPVRWDQLHDRSR